MSAPPTPLSSPVDPATRLERVLKGEIRRLALKGENLREAALLPSVGLAKRLELIARANEAIQAADGLSRALKREVRTAAAPPRPDLLDFPRPLGVEGTQ